MFGLIKSKLLLIGGAVLAVLVGIIKYLSFKNANLKKRLNVRGLN